MNDILLSLLTYLSLAMKITRQLRLAALAALPRANSPLPIEGQRLGTGAQRAPARP